MKMHKWEEVEDGNGLLKCRHCGAFMKKKINVVGQTAGTNYMKKIMPNGGLWINYYAKKGSSKWQDHAPECG